MGKGLITDQEKHEKWNSNAYRGAMVKKSKLICLAETPQGVRAQRHSKSLERDELVERCQVHTHTHTHTHPVHTPIHTCAQVKRNQVFILWINKKLQPLNSRAWAKIDCVKTVILILVAHNSLVLFPEHHTLQKALTLKEWNQNYWGKS